MVKVPWMKECFREKCRSIGHSHCEDCCFGKSRQFDFWLGPEEAWVFLEGWTEPLVLVATAGLPHAGHRDAVHAGLRSCFPAPHRTVGAAGWTYPCNFQGLTCTHPYNFQGLPGTHPYNFQLRV